MTHGQDTTNDNVTGRQALLYTREGFAFQVHINGSRRVFDRVDWLVEPVSGFGERWVSADRCELLFEGIRS